MRKSFYALLLLLCAATISKAAPGDTTWVQANNVRLDYYNNFDSLVTFPASGTYRKVYMVFTLGKYVCPGTPQYCGDWDYTVQTYFMAKNASDTVELGRFITPYAHTGYGRFTAGWTNRYIFDITDYQTILRNQGTVRIHYSGYSGGFTANVKFAFVEGTPERNVTGVQRLWHGDFAYGHGTPINTSLGTLSLTAPAGTQRSEVKMNITGHGGDDNACAEFCPNNYTLSLNSAQLVQQPFFRTDCAANDLYVQSGTWIYARANWCPGALVYTIPHTLTGISGGQAYTLGMSFPAYTSTTGGGGSPASYTIDATAVNYGAINRTADASLEDIIAPTNAEYHWRENPTSQKPRFMVRNSGSTAITSIKFEYGVAGHAARQYTWNGNLPSLSTSEIDMPAMPDLMLPAGSYGFTARIMQVNGAADGEPKNDTLRSTFNAAPVFINDFAIQLNTNNEALPGNSAVSQTAWRIEDAAGNVVARRSNCPISSVCIDTVHLKNATAYKFVMTDSSVFGYHDIPSGNNVGVSHGDGLRGFNSSNGSLMLYDLGIGLPIDLDGYMGGNFGNGFSQYFYVGGPAAVKPVSAAAPVLRISPNPAAGKALVRIEGISGATGELVVMDMTGRIIMQQPYQALHAVDVSALSAGVYQVMFAGNGLRLQQRMIIAQ